MSLNLSSRSLLDGRGRGKQQPTTGFQVGTTSTSTLVSNSLQSQRKPPKAKMNNRSLSSNKLNKLNTAPSTRPNLNRSKSTDGLIRQKNNVKRNNRSYTKLSTLQPLTRTNSNPVMKTVKSNGSLKGLAFQAPQIGLKSSGRKGKAIIRFNDEVDNEEYEDMDDAISENVHEDNNYSTPKRQSLKEQFNSYAKDPVEPSDSHDEQESDNSNQYKDPDRLDSEEISRSNSNLTEIENVSDLSRSDSNLNRKEDETTVHEDDNQFDKNNDNDQAKNQSSEQITSNKSNDHLHSNRSSTDDMMSSNMYGGSLLLSQSTGLTKKVDPKLQYSSVNSVSIPRIHSSMDSNHSESISGISFKANRYDQHQLAEPITTNKNVAPNNSYQTNQTIFNNLQRTGASQLPKKAITNNNSTNANNVVYNFSNFLNTNKEQSQVSGPPQTMETRTQQRLWLQRENSLMDVANVDANNFSSLSLNNLMFSHNQSKTNMRDYFSSKPGSGMTAITPGNQLAQAPKTPVATNNINGLLMMVQNGGQSSIQSRTEFERTNREYLNVRRHLNPIGESLHRLEKQNKDLIVPKTRKGNSSTSFKSNNHSGNGNSFKEFSPLYQEREEEGQVLLKKLWQDAIITTQTPSPNPTPKLEAATNPIPQSRITNQNSLSNLRSPQSQTPTTRAVKFAQSGQFMNSQKKEVHI